jgi:hypothetical protein
MQVRFRSDPCYAATTPRAGRSDPRPGSGPGLRSSADRGVAPARSAFAPPAVRAAKTAALTLRAALAPRAKSCRANQMARRGTSRRWDRNSVSSTTLLLCRGGQPSPDVLAPAWPPRFRRSGRQAVATAERDGGTDAVRHGGPREHHRRSTYRGDAATRVRSAGSPRSRHAR